MSTYADFETTLNIRLGDSDNFAFTQEEKDEALNEAFNDENVVTEVWDTSLTYATGTYQYPRPAALTVVKDIYIKPDNSVEQPEKISADLWEVVDTNIQFKAGADIIPNGYTLYLRGQQKLTVADTISNVNLQEFILNKAQLLCLEMYGTRKALKFIKNDTSLSEIIAFKRELERKVEGYKKRLPRSFEAA